MFQVGHLKIKTLSNHVSLLKILAIDHCEEKHIYLAQPKDSSYSVHLLDITMNLLN